MSLTSILGSLDQQVTPSKDPLLPGNNFIYGIIGKKGMLSRYVMFFLRITNTRFLQVQARAHYFYRC